MHDLDNLEEAWHRVRLGKRYDAEALRFGYDVLGNLIQIHNDLEWGRYRVGRYREFIVKDPKERLIQYLPLRDRVVQQALHQVIEPIFEKGFIYDSYACRKGKGTHRAMHRLQHFLNAARQKWPGEEIYFLHCDIHKYFPHIDHEILYGEFTRKIKCRGTLRLIRAYIDSYLRDIGMPIGTLLSQLSANIYMNIVDQFVKHDLREPYYLRYMDNFIIIHHDKKHLQRVKDEIEGVLKSKLRLEFNPKMTRIDKVSGGIELVGYRVYPDQVKIKRASATRMKKRLREMQEMYSKCLITLEDITKRVHSWLGHCKHANVAALTLQILERAVFMKG